MARLSYAYVYGIVSQKRAIFSKREKKWTRSQRIMYVWERVIPRAVSFLR